MKLNRGWAIKWFKHDADANRDRKLQDLVLDYGMEAYGLYWYVVEQIAYGVDESNFTFDLKEDSRIIAKDTGMQRQKVEDIIRYMVDIGLFQESGNVIYCFKLLDRMDSSQTSNKKFRLMIQQAKEERENQKKGISKKSHDSVKIKSGLGHELEVDVEVDIDKINNSLVTDKSETRKIEKNKKYKFSENHLRFANAMYTKILEVNGAFKKPNLEAWAHDSRLMVEREKISLNEYWKVFLWANNDHFWKDNIQSPAKLRKQYPQLLGKMKNENTRSNIQGTNGRNSSNWGDTKSSSEQIADMAAASLARRRAAGNQQH